MHTSVLDAQNRAEVMYRGASRSFIRVEDAQSLRRFAILDILAAEQVGMRSNVCSARRTVRGWDEGNKTCTVEIAIDDSVVLLITGLVIARDDGAMPLVSKSRSAYADVPACNGEGKKDVWSINRAINRPNQPRFSTSNG